MSLFDPTAYIGSLIPKVSVTPSTIPSAPASSSMDPLTIASIGSGLLNGIGNAIGGNKQAKLASEQLGDARRQQNRENALQDWALQNAYQQQVGTSPGKAYLLAQMAQRLGLSGMPSGMFGGSKVVAPMAFSGEYTSNDPRSDFQSLMRQSGTMQGMQRVPGYADRQIAGSGWGAANTPHYVPGQGVQVGTSPQPNPVPQPSGFQRFAGNVGGIGMPPQQPQGGLFNGMRGYFMPQNRTPSQGY